MKKYLWWVAAAVCLYLVYVAVSLYLLPPVTTLKDRKLNLTIQVKDWQGKYHQRDPDGADPARDEMGGHPGRGLLLLQA